MDHYFQEKFRGGGKKERTSGMLADGIIHLVSEGGRETLSARKIAATTGLSVGTVYNHFDTMDNALAFVAECIMEETAVEAAAISREVEDAAEKFTISTRFVIEKLLENPAWGKVIRDSFIKLDSIRADLGKDLMETLLLGIQQGVFRVKFSPILMIQIIEMTWTGVRFQVVFGENEAITRETCEICLRALGVPSDEVHKIVHRCFSGSD